jgi:hypothetical protein
MLVDRLKISPGNRIMEVKSDVFFTEANNTLTGHSHE